MPKLTPFFFTQFSGIAFGDQSGRLRLGSEFFSVRPGIGKNGIKTHEVTVEDSQATKPRKATDTHAAPAG